MARPVVDRVTANAQTTDATVTTLLNYTSPDNSVSTFLARITAFESSTGDAAFYILRGGWKVEAPGGATVPGSEALVQSIDSAEDQTAWDGTADLAGSALRIRITGESSKTIEWSVHLEVVHHTP